jgi:hypothetical protein
MAKKKLTHAEQVALRAAYEAWNPHDPNSISAEDLARQHGISKQTLYTYRDGWLEADRKAREAAAAIGNEEDEGRRYAAVVYLTAELVEAKTRIAELERQLERFRAAEPA